MYRLIYILGIMALVVSSCINENQDLCPDYGKYRVLFYDMYEVKNTVEYYVFIGDKYSAEKVENTLIEYKLIPGTTLLKSDKVLKRYPGKYNFVALQSTERIILNEYGIKLKNNTPYFYADTSKTIIKQSYNDVILRFKLANSIIKIKCITDSIYSSKYGIKKVLLTCPDDTGILMNLSSGLCNYSQTVGEFYEEAQYDEYQDVFFIYCVPVIRTNYLNFKVSIEDNQQKTETLLYCRIFLNTDISQGKIYQFLFNVTPFEIKYINTSISEWDEKTNINIPIN